VFGLWLLSRPAGAGAEHAADTLRVSLGEAIEIAMEQNLSVRKAEQDVLASQAGYKQARAAFLPSLSLSSSYTRYVDEADRYDLSGRQDWSQQTGLRLSWSLWQGGSRFANLSRQAASRRVAENESRNVEEQALFTVISSYVNLSRAQEDVEVARESLRLARDSRAQAQAMARAGRATRSDFLRAEVEVSLKESELLSAQTGLEDAGAALCDLLNIERAAISAEKPRFKQIVVPDMRECTEAGSGTPAVETYRARLDIAMADKRAVRATFMPTLSASASCNWSGDSYEFDDPDYSAGLTASWSLFEGGERHYRLQEAKAGERSALLDLQSKTRQVVSAIESDHRNLGYVLSKWESAGRTVQLAQESYDQISRMYELGLATSLELFSAQETLNESKLGEISSHYAVFESYARLLSDMGQLGQKVREGELYHE
jgi:outer membrane protein